MREFHIHGRTDRATAPTLDAAVTAALTLIRDGNHNVEINVEDLKKVWRTVGGATRQDDGKIRLWRERYDPYRVVTQTYES